MCLERRKCFFPVQRDAFPVGCKVLKGGLKCYAAEVCIFFFDFKAMSYFLPNFVR